MLLRLCSLALLVAITHGAETGKAAPGKARIDAPRYNAKGELLFPADTDRWITVGSSLGMGYNEQDFDPARPGHLVSVSIEPRAYDYFIKHGHFADGTMFARKSYGAEGRFSDNRAGFVMSDLHGTEVRVIDSQRFKDGFNFAVFAPDQKQAAILPDGNGCIACHKEKGAFESTFVQFYPVIRGRIPAAALEAAMKRGEPTAKP